MEKAILVKRINTAREERGICQQKAVGVVHAANRIAQKKPGLPVFIESCRQLKVSPNYLLTDY